LEATLSQEVFANLESEVRGYCRHFPVVFDRAEGSHLFDERGERYIDFFSGAGALNYGHNHPHLRGALLRYLERGAVVHSLDMMTVAKRDFLQRFDEVILRPRGMQYRIQFPGPTGTNAVEAALKLARKVTGRHAIISFTNAFHGMTLGSLSVTGNSFKRHGAGIPLNHTTVMPFCNYMGDDLDSLNFFETMLKDQGSGVDLPAAVILETVQAEGGINVASANWLRRLAELCKRHDILLIVDDIQVGCGRTGRFFSFEEAGVIPDLVCLSKSLSGYGIPLAITFVTATAALTFWESNHIVRETDRKAERVRRALESICNASPIEGTPKGRGLIQGIEFADSQVARAICAEAFKRGLIMETAGPEDNVIKLMPSLLIPDHVLEEGLGMIQEAAQRVLHGRPHDTGLIRLERRSTRPLSMVPGDDR